MGAVPFDTLKLADRLQAGGFTPEQAHTVASALADAASSAEVATRTDLGAMEVALRRDISALEFAVKRDLGALEASVKHDISALQADLKHDMGVLEANLKHDISVSEANSKHGISALELAVKRDLGVGLAETKAEILKWVVSAIGIQTVVIIGSVVALMRMGH